MRTALIGATGFVGAAILKELISRGHQVTAIVRHPEKITLTSPLLTAIAQDASDCAGLSAVLKGHDAVISAYNPGWQNPDIAADTLRIYPEIVKAVKAAGVPRLLCVGGAGSLFCAPGLRVMDSGSIPEAILPAIKALAEFYLKNLTAEKELDWVFFSPAGVIAPGERTGKFRLGKDDLIVNEQGESRISVEDYAVAMVDEMEQPAHHQERFTIGY